MTDDPPPHPALLPAGLRDLLPPAAWPKAAAIATLIEVFAGFGYELVEPPLLEFEDGLFIGAGAALAEQTFRLMDPDSQRMMGLRADITPQIARIAATRLAEAPRPLRLCYAGEVLRVRGSQMAPERQVAQAGIELIGHDSAAADAEALQVAAEALAALGIARASFDLTLPPLIPALLSAHGVPATARGELSRALDRKDAAEVARLAAPLGGDLGETLTVLLDAAGPADGALAALRRVALPADLVPLAERLAATVDEARARVPALRLTVDPVEFRGFRYHTGVAFAAYAPGRAEELGRGGRYVCGDGEPATGLTLFPDALLRAAVTGPARNRAYVPAGLDGAALRARGFATVTGLAPEPDAAAEAARLRCTHILRADGVHPLEVEPARWPT